MGELLSCTTATASRRLPDACEYLVMALSARSFAGGATTDNLVSASGITLGTFVNLYCRFNITATDATSRRFLSLVDSGGTNPQVTILTNATNTFFRAEAWNTTAGQWTIAVPSTGSEHDFLWTYDASSTANNPTCYLDGASVSVTRAVAPVGAWSPTSREIGRAHV